MDNRKNTKSLNRFWGKVNKKSGSYGADGKFSTECWEWQVSTTHDGYGLFWFNGKYVLAHRFAWILAKGAIPKNLCVLHSCDNPKCVNQNHLFLGTVRDNNLDKTAKGRAYCGDHKGEKSSTAKLTTSDVLKIRAMSAQRIHPKDIARQFGVERSTIYHIIARRSWSHIT
jgi:hypothetical protein